jgi:hypothetical protein
MVFFEHKNEGFRGVFSAASVNQMGVEKSRQAVDNYPVTVLTMVTDQNLLYCPEQCVLCENPSATA